MHTREGQWQVPGHINVIPSCLACHTRCLDPSDQRHGRLPASSASAFFYAGSSKNDRVRVDYWGFGMNCAPHGSCLK